MSPGSGAIVATARDVADFYRALLSGRLLKPRQMQAMKTNVSERTGKVVVAGPGYGLGIGRSPLTCGGWAHGGELPGYQAQAISSGDGRRQVVLMVNQDPSSLPKRVNTLFDKLLEKAYCHSA
jgi:D-alanyl-D-alanine carboxypeptidase